MIIVPLAGAFATTTGCRGPGRSLYVAAPTTCLRRDECDRPDRHRPSGSDPPTIFSIVVGAPPAVASLFLPLAGDAETNPGPSSYACGQTDTPLICYTPDCEIRTHNQTRCSAVPRSQQSLPCHCPTHGGPWTLVLALGLHEPSSCRQEMKRIHSSPRPVTLP